MQVEAKDIGVAFEQIARDLGIRVETFMQEFGQDLNERLLENTPVDTGFLRASWYASLNTPQGKAPSPKSEANTTPNVAPPMTVARLNLTIGTMKAEDTVYIINGAKYARHVEYGTSRMAARGFVRKTIAQARTIAEETAAKLRRGFGR